MATPLGKTLLVVNPVAQSGNGRKAALVAEERLRSHLAPKDLVVKLTETKDHARAIAAKATAFDTLVVLGGDGTIHETVNGLMTIPEAQRPTLALLPMGSGNDYARTLNLSFKLEESLEQLLDSSPKLLDLGCCNGEYFMETVSFGLDAAIAIDTIDRRARTGRTGTRLFLESGIAMLLHNRLTYDFVLQREGEQAQDGRMLLLAVQVGQTYGGGFRVCPLAQPDDGIFELCIAHGPVGLVKALVVFLLAKNARHTKFKIIEFQKAASLSLGFSGKVPPAQIDGEPFYGEEFEIACLPKALRVLVPN